MCEFFSSNILLSHNSYFQHIPTNPFSVHSTASLYSIWLHGALQICFYVMLCYVICLCVRDKLGDLVSRHRASLHNTKTGTAVAAAAFTSLLHSFRTANTEDILTVLKDRRNRDILW